MEKKVIELYGENEPSLLRKKRLAWITAAAAVMVLTVAVCIFFCVKTRPTTAGRMLVYTIAASTLGGWIAISILRFVIADISYAIKHTETMLKEERETIEGSFGLTDEKLLIKKGVSMQRVNVRTKSGDRHLQIYSKKAKYLDCEKAVRAESVMGFIVAYEVEDESD